MDLVGKEDVTDVEDLDIWLESAMPGKHWMEKSCRCRDQREVSTDWREDQRVRWCIQILNNQQMEASAS